MGALIKKCYLISQWSKLRRVVKKYGFCSSENSDLLSISSQWRSKLDEANAYIFRTIRIQLFFRYRYITFVGVLAFHNLYQIKN